jgi:cell division protein FtsI/penicillin-binding protein 2
MLTGKRGEYKMTFDKDGRKTSEKIITPPVPGYTVVTTLDLRLQELAEKALEAKAKRGAIVIIEPSTGDILAMASWPVFNPNSFIPNISAEKFKELQDDPNIPLLPRAFRSSYPPGSVFKVPVGIAALETGTVGPSDGFQCSPSIQVGNLTFRNWKKVDTGYLNFVEAFTQSCNTWFYQAGLKMGSGPIIEWAQRMGFGAKTGIPLRGEVEGRIPTDEYMKAAQGRKLLNGDVVLPNAPRATGADAGERNRERVSGAGEADAQCFTDDDRSASSGNGRRGEQPHRHGALGKHQNGGGGGENRDSAVGAEEQGTHRRVVRGLYADGSAAVRVRGAV